MSQPRYVKRDGTLFEVLERTPVKNAGIMGGTIIQWMLLDVIDPDAGPFTVTQTEFEKYEVVPVEDAELGVFDVEPDPRIVDRLHKALDEWANKRPVWMD